MEKSVQTTKKFFTNFLRYLVYFTLVVVTPILAQPIGPKFDWVGYGQLRKFFARLFTVIFWAIELIVLVILEKRLKKRTAKKLCLLTDVDTPLSKALQNGEEKETAIRKVFYDRAEALSIAKEEALQARKKEPLPLWNVILLTLISIGCILLISVQTDFQVKVIYDIGEKVTGHQLLDKIGMLACNIIKCIWIVLFLRVSYAMAEAFTANVKGKTWARWLICGAFLMVFGALDAFLKMEEFSWTYLFFYVLFPLVYCLTKRSGGKAYGLIMLIYIF